MTNKKLQKFIIYIMLFSMIAMTIITGLSFF